jgi:hypothetical protein
MKGCWVAMMEWWVQEVMEWWVAVMKWWVAVMNPEKSAREACQLKG